MARFEAEQEMRLTEELLDWKVSSEGGSRVEPRLAYDVKWDIDRFLQLKSKYGEDKAKQLLKIEMENDLLPHFGELGGEEGRVQAFDYRYLIDDEGRLVEEVGERALVERMYRSEESEVEGQLWLYHIIPFLEDAEVGQAAFSLSSRTEGEIEADYDYGYFFVKSSQSEVRALAVELDLTAIERREIVNQQLFDEGAPQGVMLDENSSWKDIRGRVLFYDERRFDDISGMFRQIIGEELVRMRGNYDLVDEDAFRIWIDGERDKLERKRKWVRNLAGNLVEVIARGEGRERIHKRLSRVERSEINKMDPKLIREARLQGKRYLMLSCGVIDIGESKGSSEGKGGFENGFNCPSCGGFIPSGSGDICPNCGYTKAEHVRITGESCG